MQLDKNDKYLRLEREQSRINGEIKYLFDVLLSEKYTTKFSKADTYEHMHILQIIAPTYYADQLNYAVFRSFIQDWYHAGRLQSIEKYYALRIEANIKSLIMDLRQLLAEEFSKVMRLAGYKPWSARECK